VKVKGVLIRLMAFVPWGYTLTAIALYYSINNYLINMTLNKIAVHDVETATG
jgi:hypothetical protein